MKKVLLTILGFAWTLFAFSQRATGYGRGSDWDVTSSGGDGIDYIYLFFFLILIVIGVPLFIVNKIKEKRNLASGEYVKVVKNGYIVAAPSDDLSLQRFQIVQIWKLDEFQNHFGTFKYNQEKINSSRNRLVNITCKKGSETVVIAVGDYTDAQRIFNDSNDYRVVKVKNGNYILCHK